MRIKLGIAALAVAVAGSACIEKETAHSIYLSADGSVAWTVIESDVRSDATSPESRRDEEGRFLTGALDGTNGVAAAFASLEPSRVKTRVLRRERPYAVMTDARFPDVAGLAVRILGQLRVPGDAYVITAGDVTTLHLHLDFRGMGGDAEGEPPILPLVNELATYRIVLTEGHFVSAEGFTLDDAGRVARPMATGDDVPDAVVDLALAWRR